MNIIEFMDDPQLVGDQFINDSWDAWKALLAGFYNLNTDATKYYTLTKRRPSASDFRELWLVIGRRGGKSNISALLAVYEAIFNNHKDNLSRGEIATIMVIASDRKQARTVFRYISALISESPILSQMLVKESTDTIELNNRCVIEVTTASLKSTRGYSVACAILDEISFWNSDGANPDKEILQALRPSLATLDGKLIALSSPYAKRGVLWNTFKGYFGNNDSDRILVAQAPSLSMNPSLDPRIVEQARRDDPSSARAEYDAQFRTDIETFVSDDVVERCTRSSPLELGFQRNTAYVGFVDPSGGSADAFTLSIAHMEKGKVIIDLVHAIKPPFSPEQATGELCDILHNYRVVCVHGDAYAGEWPREQFRKNKIDYIRIKKPKSELYKNLLPLLNSENIELPPSEQLTRELLNLERRTSRGGRDTIDHPVGFHDDLINAVAGVAEVTKTTGAPTPIKVRFCY